jgi:hypothetical protein
MADTCLSLWQSHGGLIVAIAAIIWCMVVFPVLACFRVSGRCSRAEEARDDAQRLREVMDAETVEMPVVELQ